jgi:hypothetical protein
MGDFNEDCNLEGNQISNLLRDSNLINVMTLKSSEGCPMPNTYDRGKRCIDMIAISKHPSIMEDTIEKAGFMPFYFEFCLDHCALYCDINTSCLFGAIKKDNMNASNCPFTTNNIQQCERFKNKAKKLYKKSKIFEKVKELEKRFEKHEPNERMDLIKECQKIGTVTSQLLLNAG